MKKLSLEEVAYPALAASGVGEKNTISNGPDDGTVNCNVAHFWSPKRHGSTAQAIDNALATLTSFNEKGVSAGGLNICGHGNEGLIETGMGQNGPYDENKFMTPWNDYNWGPELDRIASNPITYISLWACHPGAGQAGADLLYGMALRAGRAVRGGTGFLYCSSKALWWENGSVWQVATPNNNPAPIEAPTKHAFATSSARFDVGGVEMDADAVEVLEIRLQELGKGDARSFVLRGQAAKSMANYLFASEPMDLEVQVAGMVTAKIVLSFGGAVLNFTVYNDRLAIGDGNSTSYYIPNLRVACELMRQRE